MPFDPNAGDVAPADEVEGDPAPPPTGQSVIGAKSKSARKTSSLRGSSIGAKCSIGLVPAPRLSEKCAALLWGVAKGRNEAFARESNPSAAENSQASTLNAIRLPTGPTTFPLQTAVRSGVEFLSNSRSKDNGKLKLPDDRHMSNQNQTLRHYFASMYFRKSLPFCQPNFTLRGVL